ncbi:MULTISPECIES: branched-chain amino acid ABC transporter permease [unclassified Duganella]|jgi:branched-chain amino acid transport system permease protein|uniref:branched-chain amino acid ABC transporter permease n=1 Tax=unclassified Duganella TaxID=2636909 RepID=UPI00087DF72B|nr:MULTISPECIES: branched-chain amino acid ABC transporter permease [unclassified Duganella]SDG59336.1 amino acid/amide ABC transporter membrane protein 2, HAAT family [Duganella sp. OV458]SDJ82433.1 amino acid/amide ABC transporter membrane protein 2, HAAT family [Duganella sp. OV510]
MNAISLKPAVLVPLLLLLALAAVPAIAQLTEQPFYLAFFARIIIYAIAASALNLALGFGGLVSLGHALFLGLGAYSVAIPAFHGIDNGWLHLLCCVLVCGLVGLVTGAVSLRTSGIGFIMITLAFAQMGYFVFVSLKQYGGDDGTTIAATSKFFGADLGQAGTVYWVALGLLALVLWWTARLRVAPFGMVLRGARQNPRRINAIGLRSTRYQLAAYVLSAVLCGVAGMLLANLTAFASPSTLTWMISGDLIVMIVLGGIGTVFGPLLGALAFLGLEEVLKMATEYWMAVFGLVIVLIGVLGKGGIAGLLDSWGARRPAPKAAKPEAGVAVPAGEHP